MNSSLRYLLLNILFSIVPLSAVYAQWEEITTIYGGNPAQKFAESTSKYMGMGSTGLYLTDKNTIFWNEVQQFNQLQMFHVTAAGDTLFVVHRGEDFDTRIFLSTSFDEGETWEEPIVLSNGGNPEILLAYIDHQLILTGNFTGPDSLRKSNDLGQTWESVAYSPQIFTVQELLDQNNTHLLYKVNPNGNSSEIFSYSVVNDTWHEIPTSDQSGYPIQSYIRNNRIYTAIDSFLTLSIHSAALDGSDDQVVYSLDDYFFYNGFYENNSTMGFLKTGLTTPFGANDLFISNDNGQTFNFQTTLNNSQLSYGYKPFESGDCIMNSSNNIFKVSADLQTYTQITDGFKLTNINNVTSVNGALYATKAGVSFQRSDDNGATFENLTTEVGIPQSLILNQGDTIFFETVVDYDVLRMTRSFDNGLTFESFPINGTNGASAIDHRQRIALLNGTLYSIFTDYNDTPMLMSSADYGENWTEISLPTTQMGIIEIVNGALYLFGEDLYRYDQENDIWTDLNSPIVNNNVFQLFNCKMRALGNNLWINNGDNSCSIFNSITGTFTTLSIIFTDVLQIGEITYGHDDQFLWISSDYGISWESTGISLPTTGSHLMAMHNNDLLLYGLTNSSIWRMSSPMFVSGLVYYDANNNGLYDTDEPGVPNVMVHAQNSETYAMSGITGSFTLSLSETDDQLIVELNNELYTAIPQNIAVSSLDEVLIGIQVNGSISDLEVDAILTEPFRPGFSTSITAVVKNNGNIVQGGELILTLPESASFATSTVTPTSQTATTVSWSLNELEAFETRQIQLQLLNDVTAVLGDTAVFELNFNAANSDNNLDNNSLTNSSIIVGSYDPNDKACSRGVLVTPTQLSNNNEFEYLIRFQNTGTFYAENVVIQDTISSYFDLATMRIIASSDTMNVTFGENNLVNFNFPLIFLPDSTTNEPESHGFVKYAIRTKPDLQLGTVLRNTAYIYFDFNEPIITNTAETLYDLTIGYEMVDDRSILVYPNPTTSTVQLMEYANQTVSVALNDISGKAVAMQMCVNGELDLSKLNPGIYLGVISASQGQPARRFKVVKM